MSNLKGKGKLETDSTLFQCKICSTKFKIMESLTRHVKSVHSSNRPFSCSKCSYTTKFRPDLISHIRRVHDKLRPYACIFCDKAFPEPGDLNRHLFSHTRERPHACPECESSFAEHHNLTRHIKTAHRKLSLGIKCPGCPKYVPNQEIYQEHAERHALEKRDCDTCGKLFSSEFTLDLHMTRVHADRLVDCEFCPKRFANQKYYKLHLVYHTGSKSSVCDTCGKAFVTKDDMRKHMMKVHEPHRYECEFCQKTFSSGSDVRNHQIRVHAEIPEELKTFQCFMCDKRYFFKQDLVRHEACHGTSRPFKCDICKKCFKFKGDLTKHKKLHDATFKRKIRLHICPHCLKGLSSRFYLRQHIARIHLGEPPRFSCIFCGATATQRSGLFTHIRRCIREKPHFCEECDYATVCKFELRDHFREKHTNERPFKCDQSCGKTYGSKKLFRNHQRNCRIWNLEFMKTVF